MGSKTLRKEFRIFWLFSIFRCYGYVKSGTCSYTFSVGKKELTKPVQKFNQKPTQPFAFKACDILNHLCLGTSITEIYLKQKFLLKFTFELHKSQRLNLTFDKIHVVASHVKLPCRNRMRRYGPDDFYKHAPHILLTSSEAPGTISENRYSRHYSKFTTFPRGNFVTIENVAYHSGFIISTGSYQTIDALTVYSTPCQEVFLPSVWRRIEDTSAVTLVLSLQRKFLTYYLISVEKMYFVWATIFEMNDIDYSVHDGPGYLSKVLNAETNQGNNSHFKASMFQMSIFLTFCTDEAPTATLENKLGTQIIYKIKQQPQMIVFAHSRSGAIHLPYIKLCEFSNLCAIYFLTTPGHILNITIFSFKHKGLPNTDLCGNAGIKIYIKPNVKKSVEGINAHTLCVQHRFSSYGIGSVMNDAVSKQKFYLFEEFNVVENYVPAMRDKQVIYSERHKSTIVLYMYPEYSQFTVSILVKPSNCSYLGSFHSRPRTEAGCQVTQIRFSGRDNWSMCARNKKIGDPCSKHACNMSAVITGEMRGQFKHKHPHDKVSCFCVKQRTIYFDEFWSEQLWL